MDFPESSIFGNRGEEESEGGFLFLW
jgi:hypothetical protein